MSRADESGGADGALVPRIPSGVASVVVDGQAVLLDEATSQMHALNPAASLVWAQLDGRTPLANVVADLVAAHGAEPDVVRRDVKELIHDLESRGLLELLDPARMNEVRRSP